VTTRKKLTPDEVAAGLAALPGWEVRAGKLHHEWRFANFVDAFGFMAGVAFAAEQLNHHPDWSNVYNRVVVDLSTHDAGALTPLDFELARRMDKLAARYLGNA
jgi:4a-hydroxytetrahydrobiopterin dehydratase